MFAPPAAVVQPPPRFWAPPRPQQAAQVPARPRPIVRAVSPDEPSAPLPVPRHEPLRIPSPEQLGVTAPAPANSVVDWNDMHRRLDRLSALSRNVETLPQGGYRFTLHLPTAVPDRTHRVEAEAAGEAEAVLAALQKAEERAAHR